MSALPRRTKIVATLGPSSSDEPSLEAMVRAGLDVARLNLSHGTIGEHRERLAILRRVAADADRTVGVMLDLKGPKLRIEAFAGEGAVELTQGERFVLDTECASDAGDASCVGIAYPELATRLTPGRRIALDDGRILLEVEAVPGRRIICRVLTGGRLGSRKGLHVIGGGLDIAGLTDEDRAQLAELSALRPDYFALSFARDAADLRAARAILDEQGGRAGLIAKIERQEALENLDEILQAADGIMVARGDLGVEIGNARLPAQQKRLVDAARERNRIVIVATEMMESMVSNARPYRAEVFDVANAVLDGTDAMMLSAETAVGWHPGRVIETAAEICLEAEREPGMRHLRIRLHERRFQRADETIAMSAMYAADHHHSPSDTERPGVRALVAMTESGHTALLMSRFDSHVPIYAITPHVEVCGRMTLYRGVYPVRLEASQQHSEDLPSAVLNALRVNGMLASGDEVLITRGARPGEPGGTSIMQMVRVD